MILGISGSPRPNGITANAVKKVLEESGQEHEFISLAGKHIGGCISCLGCTESNRCVVNDDFLKISEAMLHADVIVFGAPNYYKELNALSHCMWERCFCFRHNNVFSLAGKLGVIISTGYSTDEVDNPIFKTVETFMISNKMEVISKFAVNASSQCYDCRFGKCCTVGNVVRDHGFVDTLTPDMYPPAFSDQPESIKKAIEAGKIIKDTLEKRMNKDEQR